MALTVLIPTCAAPVALGCSTVGTTTGTTGFISAAGVCGGLDCSFTGVATLLRAAVPAFARPDELDGSIVGIVVMVSIHFL